MTNVYKIELLVVDHDDLGANEIEDILENTKYPNWCISPSVLTIEGKDIGAYDDSHPLNNTNRRQKEVDKLFSKWQPINTAPRDGTRILFFYGSCKGIFTAWYSREIEWQTDNQICYSTWHLREPNSVMSAVYFEEENPTNCYWQPLPELPLCK